MSKNLIPKTKGPEKIFSPKNICVKKSLDQNKRGLHKLSPPKIGSTKFGQNQGSNSWDIADMDKCHQDICCLEKCHLESWHLLKIVPGT